MKLKQFLREHPMVFVPLNIVIFLFVDHFVRFEELIETGETYIVLVFLSCFMLAILERLILDVLCMDKPKVQLTPEQITERLIEQKWEEYEKACHAFLDFCLGPVLRVRVHDSGGQGCEGTRGCTCSVEGGTVPSVS